MPSDRAVTLYYVVLHVVIVYLCDVVMLSVIRVFDRKFEYHQSSEQGQTWARG